MKDRQFVRHPSDVPIDINYDLSGFVAHKTDYLNDIGFGGLSFQSKKAMELGALVNVQLPLGRPVFEIKARVAWCRRRNGTFDVGVEFVEPENLFKARIVEQVCQIEHYKHEALEKEGRELTGEEAAMEWIKKNAADFPKL